MVHRKFGKTRIGRKPRDFGRRSARQRSRTELEATHGHREDAH